MKKIAVVLLLIILLTCPSVANAEGTKWVRIVRNDTYLYATEDCSKQLFALEKSYYAEILQELDKTYFVKVDTGDKSFPNLCGYVLKNEVRVQENAPDNPLYPTEKLVVKSSSAMLKLSPTPSAEILIVASNTQKVCYYGKAVGYGQNWYYVYFAGEFGYVLASDVTAPNVQLHPTPIDIPQEMPTVTPPTEDTPTQVPQESPSPTAEIILTVFVSLLAVAITCSLFLPVKSKKQVFDGDI